MAAATLKVVITQAWWLKPILYTLAIAYGLTGRELSDVTVRYWTVRGTNFSFASDGIGGA